MRRLLAIILSPFFLFEVFAQSEPIPIADNDISRRYPFISSIHNRITNESGLDSFFTKLERLHDSKEGKISIVHIGDSHIQADFLSGAVRASLQKQFGNAGRGLVFPYQLAKSNAPADITSASGTSWQFNRLAHPEIPDEAGISGFVIHSTAQKATLGIALKDGETFERVRLFMSHPPANACTLVAESIYYPSWDDNSFATQIWLDSATSGFSLTIEGTETKDFFGASLENHGPGILYHSIGVNGARYDHYNIAEKFWDQLGELDADLYIISLGTNEAQQTVFNAASFRSHVDTFLSKLKLTSPKAEIIITTAPGSYKRGRSNVVLRDLNKFLAGYCERNKIPIWDLYRASSGFGSAYQWNRRKLMSRDKIHFTAEGYRLQGVLLFNAIAKGYNAFIKR